MKGIAGQRRSLALLFLVIRSQRHASSIDWIVGGAVARPGPL